MQLENLAELRPALYHLTARTNLARIQRLGRLDPAKALLESAGHPHLQRTQRSGSLTVVVDGEPVRIRDQDPLRAANCRLDGGFSFEDLLDLLNQHVFFWPGSNEQPVRSGRNHFARYAAREDAVVFKFATQAVFEANPDLEPRFCKYNSGAPRSNPRSGKSPRGPDLFLPADRFAGSRGDVVEVVFRGSVALPMETVEILPVQHWHQ